MNHLLRQDPKINLLINQEIRRQQEGLTLIASENIVSLAVLAAIGSPLTNKYAEGYPAKRYYQGNQYIDQAEDLARQRACKLFKAPHANVQPHSGSQANQAAYMAVLKPGDKVLAMDLSCGGHLTHGAKFNFSGQIYNFIHYSIDRETGLLDMAEVRKIAKKEKPRAIVVGASAYPRQIDFAAFGAIAREIGAYLIADIAHIAGLVAAGLHPSPFPHADIATATTHKTLRGPRGGLILCQTNDRLATSRLPSATRDPSTPLAERIGANREAHRGATRTITPRTLAARVDAAVFPGCQGGPLENIIAGKAVAFKEALTPEFKHYQKQVLANAQTLARDLTDLGMNFITGGTDTHLLLADTRNLKIDGHLAALRLAKIGIYANKNLIPYDSGTPDHPSGLRLGTPAITTRGFKARDTGALAEIIWACLTQKISQKKLAFQVRSLARHYPIYPLLLN